MEYLTLGHPPFQGLATHQLGELFGNLPTPAYVIDQARLEQNGQVLSALAQRTGCHILLAQKAFSNYDFYPLLSQFLAGTEASGLYEARLGFEEMGGKEVHVFCAGYREDEFGELLNYADHIVFNSIHQLKTLGPRAKAAGKSVGLRINPQCSTQEGHAIYDPCAPGSRMGVTREIWNAQMDAHTLELLDGLHFHTLCEQNADDLATTLEAVEEKFGDVLPGMKWLNMGGGHHITRPDYQMDTLEGCIRHAQEAWGVEVYLEPGEAVALNAGYLVSRVVDLVENAGVHIAILDASAACHMPDVLEMPYQPPILHAVAQPGGAHTYRLAGPTCLAGDVVGDYSFAQPLHRGDLVVFGDMAIYTTCKNNTFNGMPLPDLWRLDPQGGLAQLTQFGYHNFKARLGR
ncbi:carboxynorspermidine decarboxylase [Pseudoflavonifractor sp. SW1122]|uniref:carboxynorspermidine decarboxylase n=1 Tax=Pseudoflavonifractor sp. SW1122 TaxID=2530044 RepID=UPI00143A244E|nr:carboxynorspermidine decarboxylase [Pseudoflavonifractor sp. SW1122]NJE74636.1 carboxynorspermidine decarboxylase [Pseudoflavonifractor sp. SW1122]